MELFCSQILKIVRRKLKYYKVIFLKNFNQYPTSSCKKFEFSEGCLFLELGNLKTVMILTATEWRKKAVGNFAFIWLQEKQNSE